MMIKEFKRQFFKPSSLWMMALVVIVGGFSFYNSYQAKLELIDFIQHPPSTSVEPIHHLINLKKLYLLNTNAISFMVDFFQSSFNGILLMLMLLASGLFLAPTLNKQIDSGMMNHFKTRGSYQKQVKNILFGQALTIFVVFLTSYIVLLFLAIVLNGFNLRTISYRLGFSISLINLLFYLLLMALVFSILVILITWISTVLNLIFRRNLILQVLPITLFGLFNLVIRESLVNLSSNLTNFISLLNPSNYAGWFSHLLMFLSSFTQETFVFDAMTIYPLLSPILVLVGYGLVFLVLYRLNISSFERDLI